jgi:hypothetical protein
LNYTIHAQCLAVARRTHLEGGLPDTRSDKTRAQLLLARTCELELGNCVAKRLRVALLLCRACDLQSQSVSQAKSTSQSANESKNAWRFVAVTTAHDNTTLHVM